MTRTLNTNQLKNLIINEVKRLREAPDMDAIGDLDSAVDEFVETMRQEWISSIEGDPGAKHVGHVNQLDHWAEEVEKACLELAERLDELVNEIDMKLNNGEYSSW